MTRPAATYSLLLAALCGLAPGSGSAQDALRAQCRSAATIESTRQFCELGSYAAEALIAGVGIASAAGNPVPGTASTFGMKLGPLPRMSLTGRMTLSGIELPPVERRASSDRPDGLLASLNTDASVGLFTGFSLFPTVGGFLSVDLLGTFGLTWLPGGDGFDDDRPINWAAGARLGITRESFTAPGISLSGMYRNLGEVSYGRGDLTSTDAFIHADNHHVWNLRGAISKRLSLLSATGGVGYDIHTADVLLRVADSGALQLDATESDVSVKRWSAFVNGALTMLIASLVGEVGWQQGADSPDGLDGVGGSTFFASIALRLAI